MGLEVGIPPQTWGAQNPQPDAQGAPAPVAGGTGDVVNDKSKAMAALVQQMLQRMAPRPALQQPSARAGYGENDLQRGGMVMGNQGSNMGEIGAGIFNIGTAVKNSVAASKERQVQTAMSDWNTLQTRWENAIALSGGDQQKAQQIYEKDPYVVAVLGDSKKTKNLSKVFNVDLMNPGKAKDTVYGQALERHQKVNKAKGMLDAVRQKLHLGGGSKPAPPTPEQRQSQTHENVSRLPFVQQTPDPTKAAEFLEKQREFDIRSQEANARIQEMHVRTAEMVSHNKEQIRLAEERLADAKTAREDRKGLQGALLGLRQQAQELQELSVMLKAGND